MICSKMGEIEAAEASEKGAELLAKLRPQQGRLGIAVIVIGILAIISALAWRIG